MAYFTATSDPASVVAYSNRFRGPAAVAYDFRSDTMTVPTPEMLQVMAEAPVGDDGYEEDPSILALESHIAQLLNKPAALFVSSGTLSNQLAIRAHLALAGGCPPYSVLCDSRAHVLTMEAGGIPAHTGATVLAVPVEKDFGLGLRTEPYLTAKDIEQGFVPDDGNVHNTPTRLVCLENTLGGAIMPLAAVREMREATQRLNVPLHMDGARLWNACAELGIEPREYAELCDSVSVCLSKGIGAPVGSVLVGSELLIRRARHLRKMYGGAWRQAGLLAAAAQYALGQVYPKGLVRSHDMARRLAQGLQEVGAKVANPGGKVETNMVFVDWVPLGWTCEVVAKAFAEDAKENPDQPPIRVFGGGAATKMRMVLHYQLADDAAERVVGVVRRLKERQEKARREGLAN